MKSRSILFSKQDTEAHSMKEKMMNCIHCRSSSLYVSFPGGSRMHLSPIHVFVLCALMESGMVFDYCPASPLLPVPSVSIFHCQSVIPAPTALSLRCMCCVMLMSAFFPSLPPSSLISVPALTIPAFHCFFSRCRTLDLFLWFFLIILRCESITFPL